MPRRKKHTTPSLRFVDKLVLNQWMLSLLGIDPLAEHKQHGKRVRAFEMLAAILRDVPEGLDADGLHRFHHALKTHWQSGATLTLDELLRHEEAIVGHTRELNDAREAHGERRIEWKYYQWLTLLFVEIYLSHYFGDRDGLLASLNACVDRFNAHWQAKGHATGITPYAESDLNKLCLQSATGSGKTLLMHVNIRQFIAHAREAGQEQAYARTLLITPNEGLSAQHDSELAASGFTVARLAVDQNDLFTSQPSHLDRVDYIEITKLGDKDGDKTIATRNLGDENLVLVDEGHRGMGSDTEGGWFDRREQLTHHGFTFEYSATFREAVNAAKKASTEESYAKAVLFDYSYRFFYADGYGKDYRIFNLPDAPEEHEYLYLTACLLAFYQQLRLYEDNRSAYRDFNLEKPLWVFVGASVSNAKAMTAAMRRKDASGKSLTQAEVEAATSTDITRILGYIATFLGDRDRAVRAIETLLAGSGAQSGLVDAKGSNIFDGALLYLTQCQRRGEDAVVIHQDILARLFHNPAGGQLKLLRLKGDSGEILLTVGNASKHFGLINVGDAKGLADLVQGGDNDIAVMDSDFAAGQFASVKESSSPINLLIGAKKFIEGWDCWRVSTLGLMHVGKSEGAQIIQLFGRGVRLKGHEWSLKRSSALGKLTLPDRYMPYLETLNVFGVEADFMAKFRDFLEEEGLPSNDDPHVVEIPMNVTYDFGTRLKVIRPRRKDQTGREYNFNRDGAMPRLGELPQALLKNPIVVDWYPRIQSLQAPELAQGNATSKHEAHLTPAHVAFLDLEVLYFELETYKARQNLYSLIIGTDGVRALLARTDWYTLQVPRHLLEFGDWNNVRIWQQMALELLKRYAKKYFLHCADAFIRPRLEVRELTAEDENIPRDGDVWRLVVDASEAQLVSDLEKLEQAIAKARKGKCFGLLEAGDLEAMRFGNHLYQPLLHVPKGSPVKVAPVSLVDSEMDFVKALYAWIEANGTRLEDCGASLYLLRNQSRGKGIGFFEAGNFYPDFILWLVLDNKQVVIFIEPHGLTHEAQDNRKVEFHKTIKDVEQRLGDHALQLESYLLTPTPFARMLDRGLTEEEWAARHVFFMPGNDSYVEEMLAPSLP